MTVFSVPDMSCGHCKAAIEKALGPLDGDIDLEFDMDAREVDVETTAPIEGILAALEGAGYPAKIVD